MLSVLNLIKNLVDLSFWRYNMADSSKLCVHHGRCDHNTVDCEFLKGFREGFRNTASPIFHDTAPGFAAYRRFIREFETDEDAVPLARWPRAGSTSMAQDGAASRTSDQPNGNCAITFSHNTLHEGRIHVPGSHSTLHLQHHQHQRQNQHQHQPRDTPEQKIDVNEVNFSIQSHDDERLPEMK